MELLAFLFALCLISVGIWFAYTRVIRPIKNEELRRAQQLQEKERQRHWQEWRDRPRPEE